MNEAERSECRGVGDAESREKVSGREGHEIVGSPPGAGGLGNWGPRREFPTNSEELAGN